ncbi:MAG: hypothetical protein HY923_10660 [Elusimicrobia bacterium]|nr:hypothetical protein [Elusimicrobiota bacterium]
MAITPVPSQTVRVHVYELINRTRLESLLVVTSLESTVLLARLRREPPVEAGFWQLGDDVTVEILAQHMRDVSADEFLKQYLEHMQRRTWRFRVWRT